MTVRRFVAGSLTIPIYIAVPPSQSDRQSIRDVINKFKIDSVSVIHADIHTWDGRSHPLNARRCNFEWFEVVNEDEIF